MTFYSDKLILKYIMKRFTLEERKQHDQETAKKWRLKNKERYAKTNKAYRELQKSTKIKQVSKKSIYEEKVDSLIERIKTTNSLSNEVFELYRELNNYYSKPEMYKLQLY